MYGRADNYGSPSSYGEDEEMTDIDLDLEAMDEDEDDDDEFGAVLGIGKGGGVLGIALTEKAQRNKIDRILGKLKKIFEKAEEDPKRFGQRDQWKKLQAHAKALSKVNLIQKKGYETPEIAAWVDFASSGDQDALREALEAIAWTGDESFEDDSNQEVEGEVYDAGGGGGRPHRGLGKRLPPGFRPRGYSRWPIARKIAWLHRHPRAASVRIPIDPGPMPGRMGRPRRHSVSNAAGVRGGPAVVAPRPVFRPFRKPVVRPVFKPFARPSPAVAAPPPLRMAAARAAGRTIGRKFAASRFGLDGAVEDGVEDFGALIGADAFQPLQDKDSLSHDELFLDDLDDDIEGLDSDDDDDDDDGDESMGAYIASYGEDDDDDDDEEMGAYIPSFGAIFKRDLDKRLEAARARYERLRAKETDEAKVSEAWQDYQRLVKAYRRASEMPTAQSAGPSLARSWGHQVEDLEAPEDYADPEDQPFRLRGRVAEVDDDLDDEEEEA